MDEKFNPYTDWLGIPENQLPPTHYRLLGVEAFETNTTAISNAADRVMLFIRTFQMGQHSDESQQILNEIAAARVCLLNPQKKAEYDESLRQKDVDASSSWRRTPPPPVSAVTPIPVNTLATKPKSVKSPEEKTGKTPAKEKSGAKEASLAVYAIIGGGIWVLVFILAAYLYFWGDSGKNKDGNSPKAEISQVKEENTSDEKLEENARKAGADSGSMDLVDFFDKPADKTPKKPRVENKTPDAPKTEETAAAEDGDNPEPAGAALPEEKPAEEEPLKAGGEDTPVEAEKPEEKPEDLPPAPPPEKKPTNAGAPAEDPFKNFPGVVALPDIKTSSPVKLGTVEANKAPWTIQLLGSDTASQDFVAQKRSKEGAKGFSLRKKETAVDKLSWEVTLPMGKSSEEVVVATLKREKNSLMFQWFPWEGAAPKNVAMLCNCALKMECNGKTAVVALREPVLMPTLNAKDVLKTGKQLNINPPMMPPLPAASVLFLEVTRVGDLDPGAEYDKFFTLPEPKKISDIMLQKEPLVVSFLNDANNRIPVLSLSMSISQAGKSSGSMAVAPAFLEMIPISADARSEPQYKEWDRITKDEKVPEPVKIRAKNRMWFYEKAKRVAGVDIEYRVYMKLGEEEEDEIELFGTEQKDVEAKKDAEAQERNRGGGGRRGGGRGR